MRSTNPLYSFIVSFLLSATILICFLLEASQAQDAHPDDREIVDAACRFTNGSEGTRQAVCTFIYDDGTVAAYFQPVTISEDGLIEPVTEMGALAE